MNVNYFISKVQNYYKYDINKRNSLKAGSKKIHCTYQSAVRFFFLDDFQSEGLTQISEYEHPNFVSVIMCNLHCRSHCRFQ